MPILYHLTQSILGHTKAMEMFCTGRKMSAREAADRGLVTRLLDGDPDNFEERVEAELSRLANVPAKVRLANQFGRNQMMD